MQIHAIEIFRDVVEHNIYYFLDLIININKVKYY